MMRTIVNMKPPFTNMEEKNGLTCAKWRYMSPKAVLEIGDVRCSSAATGGGGAEKALPS
jgi:hypothetical protein